MVRLLTIVLLSGLAAGCATGPRADRTYGSYTVNGVTYTPLKSARGFREEGVASWYGFEHAGKETSSGERYNPLGFTAAHKTLPLMTSVRVTNLENGKLITVRINDRGPFTPGRIIDLSYSAAKRIGIVKKGLARVRIEALPKP